MAGRIRSIKPELLEDEKAAVLSDAAWRLFVSSWLLADDYGNLRASPRYLAAQVWQDTSKDVGPALKELADSGRLSLYEIDGQLYASIPNWGKHQRVDNAGKPRVPPPPTKNQALSVRFAESRGDSPRLAATRGGSPLGPKNSPLDLRPPTSDLDQRKEDVGFENPPPSGAGPSFGPSDPAPLADDLAPATSFGDLAPVDAPDDAPAPWSALTPEPTDDAEDDPAPVSEPESPAVGQPEPPATSPADEPAQPAPAAPALAGSVPAPRAPSAPGQAALPLTLTPPSKRHDPVEAIFAEYVAAWKRVVRGRRAPTLDDKRRKLTLARLREFGEDDLKAAARGVFASEWHVSERRTDYDLVMRDAAHVERFAALDVGPPAPAAPAQKPDGLNQRPRPRFALRAVEEANRAAVNIVDLLADVEGAMITPEVFT